MRLAHLGLTVTDQERSRRFYETHFGFDAGPARTYPDGTLIIHDDDGFALALHPGAAAPDDDFLHFGYVCGDPTEVRAARARLLAAGVALAEDEDTDTAAPTASGPAGSGPVVGSIPREGKGYGVGSGTGSVGMLQDPDFVLYYQAVQDKIKKAWSFMGGSSDLTATVDFSIGPDGALTGVKLAAGSKDSAFDESVIRAIRRAAPFPAPPDKYRSEFTQGIEAQFALGDLRS